MILVLLGTQNNSFQRLLEKIEELIQNQVIQEDVIVQAGYTKYQTQNMRVIDFMTKEEITKPSSVNYYAWRRWINFVVDYKGKKSNSNSKTSQVSRTRK